MNHVPTIKNNYRRCAYNVTDDFITIPTLTDFDSPDEFYNSLFHELIHSTGHASRLNSLSVHDTQEKHSLEELVAEIGSAYLCSMCGISNSVIDNQAAYVNWWLKLIGQDQNVLIKASTLAKEAVEYLLTPGHLHASELVAN